MRCALMLEGLRTEGFREPEQVVVLVRATGGDPARSAPLFAELVANKIDILLPMGGLTLTLAANAAATNALAADLVNRRVDVIFANSPSISAALGATKTIPIIFHSGDDPVRLGFV